MELELSSLFGKTCNLKLYVLVAVNLHKYGIGAVGSPGFAILRWQGILQPRLVWPMLWRAPMPPPPTFGGAPKRELTVQHACM